MENEKNECFDMDKMPDDAPIGIESSDIESDTISFHINNGLTEVLKFCPNGDIYIHGRLAENDKEVVDGFREFLQSVNK